MTRSRIRMFLTSQLPRARLHKLYGYYSKENAS
jgi:hypothetical protein